MTQIGAISVKITADDSGFQSSVKNAENTTKNFGKSLQDNAAKFAKWGAVAAGAAAAAGAAIWKSQARSIDALAKTSDKLGIAVQDLQALRFAAEQTGVSTQTLDTALQRMTRRVSEAAGGTGVATKALEELNLNAQDLQSLAPDEQLSKIATAMDQVANQGDRVRLAMQLFDTEGVALVNTLRGGEDALNAFKNEAELLGLTLTRVDASKVEQANDSLNRIDKMIQGGLQQGTAELAPIIGGLADEFKDLVIEAGGFGQIAMGAIEGTATAVGVLANGFHGIKIIIKGLEAAFYGFDSVSKQIFHGLTAGVEFAIKTAIDNINGLIEKVNKLPGVSLPAIDNFASGFSDRFRVAAENAKLSFNEVGEELHNLLMQPLPSDQIDSWIAETKQKYTELAVVAAESMAGGSSEQQAMITDQQRAELEKRIEMIRQAGLTENQIKNEQFAADLESLKLALENKMITEAEFEQMTRDRVLSHQEQLTAIENQGAEARARVAEMEAQAKLNAQKGFFDNLAALMNTGSKKAFNIGKTAAIASASISGTEAAVSAWRAGMATGGPTAPLVAAAYASASLAKTGAQIAAIKSQSFSRGAGQGNVFSGGLPATPTTNGGGFGGESGGGGGGRNISISLTGSSFSGSDVRSLIEQINEAVGDGATLNAG